MKFAENYSRDRVPDVKAASGFQIAQVYIGIGVTLPAFLVAAQVFASLGTVNALIALAISGAVLFAFGAMAMATGAQTRLSTYAIIANVFGERLALAVNMLMVAVLLGWYAVTVSLFADAFNSALNGVAGVGLADWAVKVAGGGVMILLTLYGFSAIERLSRIVVPLLVLILAIQFAVVLGSNNAAEIWSNRGSGAPIASLGVAVSILVGAFMAGVTISPDIARFARSTQQAVLASLLSFGIGVQFVFAFAGMPSIATQSSDFVGNLIVLGLGWPAMFVVIFATITTNVSNLYSISLGLGKIIKSWPEYWLTILAGAIGTGAALLGFEAIFVPFLIFLGIAIPPIAGVYSMRVLVLGGLHIGSDIKLIQIDAMLAWIAGSTVAFLTSQEFFTITFAPAIDGFITSALAYFVLGKVFNTHRR